MIMEHPTFQSLNHDTLFSLPKWILFTLYIMNEADGNQSDRLFVLQWINMSGTVLMYKAGSKDDKILRSPQLCLNFGNKTVFKI